MKTQCICQRLSMIAPKTTFVYETTFVYGTNTVSAKVSYVSSECSLYLDNLVFILVSI